MTTPMVRAIRGATTCGANSAEEINAVTRELLQEMLRRNEMNSDEIISILLTTSPDLTASFPAAAARELGLDEVPLICASEINVPGALGHCVRIMLHGYSVRARADIRHVYLHDAVTLRNDIN